MITPEGIALFSKNYNEQSVDGGHSNSPLGIYLDVDLEVTDVSMTLDPLWEKERKEKQLSQSQILSASKQYNNVITEIYMAVKIIKPSN